MDKRLSISEARARLPELAKHLASNPGDVVIIEHRDLEDRIVMINEKRLRLLEGSMKKSNEPGAFKLAGSITSTLTDDELDAALAAARKEAAERSEARFREFMEP